jgi:hypothetical protein
MTVVFLATGVVNVSSDCVKGHLAHQTPLSIFGPCGKAPGYGPWTVIFGVVGGALGLVLALGMIQLSRRNRSKCWRTGYAG